MLETLKPSSMIRPPLTTAKPRHTDLTKLRAIPTQVKAAVPNRDQTTKICIATMLRHLVKKQVPGEVGARDPTPTRLIFQFKRNSLLQAADQPANKPSRITLPITSTSPRSLGKIRALSSTSMSEMPRNCHSSHTSTRSLRV